MRLLTSVAKPIRVDVHFAYTHGVLLGASLIVQRIVPAVTGVLPACALDDLGRTAGFLLFLMRAGKDVLKSGSATPTEPNTVSPHLSVAVHKPACDRDCQRVAALVEIDGGTGTCRFVGVLRLLDQHGVGGLRSAMALNAGVQG